MTGHYKDRIECMRDFWLGKVVEYEGKRYTVLAVDYNGMLLIDRPSKFTPDTAVSPLKVKAIK